MSEAPQIPEKSVYQVREVCQYTDTQPYVLRFWESEFPQLKPEKSRSGQPVYSRADIDLILRIKQLLYEEELTLDSARETLAAEGKRRRGAKTAKRPAKGKKSAAKAGSAPQPEPQPASAPPRRQAQIEFDTVPRERYEDAVDEIAHLRLQLREAESKVRRAESQKEKLGQEAETHRQRCEKAVENLEQLLKRLT